MDKKIYKLESNISVITIITVISYATYAVFKLGNSVYYGYPIDLISIDFNSLIITLIQNVLIIGGLILLLRNAYKSTNSLLQNVLIITAGMISPLIIFGDIFSEFEVFIVNIILYFLIFALNSFLKITLKLKSLSITNRWNIGTIITYFLLVFYLGNYSPSFFRNVITDNNEIVISKNGNDALMLICDSDGLKVIKIESMLGKQIVSKRSDVLVRDWFTSKCIHYAPIKKDFI